MTLTWPTGHFYFLHPEGPGNRQEATSDSPGRSGRRVRNFQTRFSPVLIQCRATSQTLSKQMHLICVLATLDKEPGRRLTERPAPRVGPSEWAAQPGHR